MNADEFCSKVINLVGNPYSKTDCIGVIRQSLEIRCQGTNWLWRSIHNSEKYKYLILRGTGAPDALLKGMILFRLKNTVPDGYSDPPDCHHCGVYVGNGIVVQSNPVPGVFTKNYISSEWNGWGLMKQVNYKFLDFCPGNELPFSDLPPDPEQEAEIELSDHEMIKAIYQKIIKD